MLKYNIDMLSCRLHILKTFRKQGFKYIARAEHGELRAYKKKPEKEINFWYVRGEIPYPINSAYLEDIEWSSNRPLNIAIEIKRIDKALIHK